MKQDISDREIEVYLASVSAEARAALEDLRATIRKAAPKATERVSYRMPAFHYLGPLVSYAAFKDHCSFFPMSYGIMARFKEELKPYAAATATLHFTPDKPLPRALVRKIVKARVEENEAKQAARIKKKGQAGAKS